MKITGPKDKLLDSNQLMKLADKLQEDIESELNKQHNGLDRYDLFIVNHYPAPVMVEVRNRYSVAGWNSVTIEEDEDGPHTNVILERSLYDKYK
jgi:hypothetical protein